MLHFPGFQFLQPCKAALGTPVWWIDLTFFLLAFAACWGVSVISFRWIEQPGMRLGKFLSAPLGRVLIPGKSS